MNALRVRAGAGQISGVGRQTFRVYEGGWEGSKAGSVPKGHHIGVTAETYATYGEAMIRESYW